MYWCTVICYGSAHGVMIRYTWIGDYIYQCQCNSICNNLQEYLSPLEYAILEFSIMENKALIWVYTTFHYDEFLDVEERIQSSFCLNYSNLLVPSSWDSLYPVLLIPQ